MKPITVFIIIFISAIVYAGDDNYLNLSEESLLHRNYFDPGHKQKRGSQMGKDRSAIEAYLGLQPSFSLKLNFYGAKHGSLTERGYMMLGMDFDTDLWAKFGVLLNPGRRNKNRSLSNPIFGWWKLWRYVMVRQAVELGYKGQFLDTEDDVSSNNNYGGLTANYSLIFDGNFIFDKTAWYFFDHRTARRIRFKIDAGIFFNLNKFNQPDLGFLSLSNEATGRDYNEDALDDFGQNTNLSEPNYNSHFGQPKEMDTYPVISPFLNLSIGFAF